MFSFKAHLYPLWFIPLIFHQAGFKGGYGRDWYNVIPCHGRCGSLTLDNNQESYLEILPTLKGSDIVGRFILEVGGETVVRGGCLPKEFTSGEETEFIFPTFQCEKRPILYLPNLFQDPAKGFIVRL